MHARAHAPVQHQLRALAHIHERLHVDGHAKAVEQLRAQLPLLQCRAVSCRDVMESGGVVCVTRAFGLSVAAPGGGGGGL
jgi:hypothetical protein